MLLQESIVREYGAITTAAVKSLAIRKTRSFLSILGIVCGVAALFAMISVGEGARQKTLRGIEALGTKNIIIKAKQLSDQQRTEAQAKLSMGLSERDIRTIEYTVSSVEAISAIREQQANVLANHQNSNTGVLAVSANYLTVRNLRLASGRFIGHHDTERGLPVAVLGGDVAREFANDGRLGGKVIINGIIHTVIGILGKSAKKDEGKNDQGQSAISGRNHDQLIFIPLSSREQDCDVYEDNAFSEIIIRIRKLDKVESSAAVIERILTTTHHQAQDYSLVLPLQLLDRAKEAQKTFDIVLGAIASISLLVGGIGIMNVMLASVSERQREIGIRRAIGANRRQILIQFLAEALVLTLVGGLLGLASGVAIVVVIGVYSGLAIAIVPWSLLLSLFMATLVGIFSGSYPAMTASRLNPIEALRGG
uniref:Putative ABC transport system permease protein n=1 Tax=Candidatus Kentrum sp. UNK TaxID=2126344 RepID=A0A451ALN9_9GAMM|nr:MAG: putative ABC transport system permease protein [Candidatus Kentron sp. UNK]VFK71096.1 MAG: putative ABC transport system permease protein [Candidatus Kentron sp. UNK]